MNIINNNCEILCEEVHDYLASLLEVDGRIDGGKPLAIKNRISALQNLLEQRKKALDASKELHQLLR